MSGNESRADARAEVRIDVEAWRHAIRAETFSNYHLEMGRATLREGSLDVALNYFRQAVTIKPTLAEAHLRIVELLRRLERDAEADVAHQAALALNPGYSGHAFVAIALNRLEREAPEEALIALNAAEEGGAAVDLVTAARGLVHLAHGRIAAATDCLRQVAALPDEWAARVAEEFGAVARAAFLRKDNQGAQIGFEAACRLAPDFGSDRDFWAFGKTYENMGRITEALDCYRRGIMLTNGWSEVSLFLHFHKGAAHQSLGQWGAALDVFEHAVKFEPGNAWTHFHRGILLQHWDRLEEAIAAYDRGLAIARNDFWGLQYKAAALDVLGCGEEARTLRRQAEPQMPGSPWIAYFRAAALAQAERFAEAEATLGAVENQLAELDPTNAGLFHLLHGGLLRAGGQPAAAMPYLATAADQLPGNPWPEVNRVAALTDLGRKEEAATAGAALVTWRPDLGWAWLVHGRALAACGRAADAEITLRTGLSRAPGIGWANLYLGGAGSAVRERRAAAAS